MSTTTTTPAAAAAAADASVKSNLFKDVKYFVNGTPDPEVSRPTIFRLFQCLPHIDFSLSLCVCVSTDPKIAGQWWCILNKNYVSKYHAHAVRSGFR